jgi:CubicO group peptidase (beta-lactamase class C family)
MGGAVAEPAADGQFDARAFEQFTLRHLKLTGIPGVSVAITRGTTISLVAGYGHDSAGAPVTANTPMFAGSLSKSFTALAVMQLVEAGRVNLDTPVHEYLKEFVLADPRYIRITVRHLLNQTSGMSDLTFFEWANPGPASLQAAIAELRHARLAAEPGAQFNYHNPNFEVAARLVEVVSGQPFARYMREHVFAPLGMNSTTTVDRTDDLDGKVPLGHVFAFGHALPVRAPAFFLNGAGGVVTTAADMARWLIAQNNGGVGVNGVRVLSAEGMSQMHVASAPGMNYGFGWLDGRTETPPRIYHAGWTPTFTAYQSLSLAGRHDVAVLSNGARTFVRGSGASYLSLGVSGIEAGRPAVSFGESTMLLDVILSVVGTLALALGMLGVWRSGRWAVRRTGCSGWVTTLRLAPCVAILLLVAAVPKIVGDLMGGRVAAWSVTLRMSSWLWIFYVSPMLVVLCGALAGASGAVLVARLARLHRGATGKSGDRWGPAEISSPLTKLGISTGAEAIGSVPAVPVRVRVR